MRRAGLTVAGALLVLAVGCTTTRTVYVPAKASSSATTGNVSPDSGYPTAPDTYSPPAQSTTQTLNSTCVVDGTDANDESSYGWTLTFTNPSSTDITVGGYTVVFFGTDGSETGSRPPPIRRLRWLPVSRTPNGGPLDDCGGPVRLGYLSTV